MNGERLVISQSPGGPGGKGSRCPAFRALAKQRIQKTARKAATMRNIEMTMQLWAKDECGVSLSIHRERIYALKCTRAQRGRSSAASRRRFPTRAGVWRHLDIATTPSMRKEAEIACRRASTAHYNQNGDSQDF